MNPHALRPAGAAFCVPFAFAAISLILPSPFARGEEPASIAWQADYNQAFDQAQAANKLLWIQFTGPWCPNCTRMERDSFPHAAVIEHSQRSFVPLKLRSDWNEALVAGFNLTAIPATIIVAPNRDIIALHQGYLGPEQLDALLRESLARSAPATNPATEKPESPREALSTQPSQKKEKQPSAAGALAMAGYCPVSLVEDRKLVKGRSEHTIVHEGGTYRFASAASIERFRQQPARYVPWNGGSCPVNQLDEGQTRAGDPHWGVLYAGKLFLCATEADRRRFVADPGPYAAQRVPETAAAAGESRPESAAKH